MRLHPGIIIGVVLLVLVFVLLFTGTLSFSAGK
jgi:hypothetical protein